jgi:hypothetical protein
LGAPNHRRPQLRESRARGTKFGDDHHQLVGDCVLRSVMRNPLAEIGLSSIIDFELMGGGAQLGVRC